MVLEAEPMHEWMTAGGRVVGHPSTPGEELKGGKKAETPGNSKERSKCIPEKSFSYLKISSLPILLWEGRAQKSWKL